MQNKPILVIGSTGKTGQRIARTLEERGFPVRPGSRNAKIPFDWEKPETWAPALKGVSSVYVSSDIPHMTGVGAPDWAISACRATLHAGRGAKDARHEPRRLAASP